MTNFKPFNASFFWKHRLTLFSAWSRKLYMYIELMSQKSTSFWWCKSTSVLVNIGSRLKKGDSEEKGCLHVHVQEIWLVDHFELYPQTNHISVKLILHLYTDWNDAISLSGNDVLLACSRIGCRIYVHVIISLYYFFHSIVC